MSYRYWLTCLLLVRIDLIAPSLSTLHYAPTKTQTGAVNHRLFHTSITSVILGFSDALKFWGRLLIYCTQTVPAGDNGNYSLGSKAVSFFRLEFLQDLFLLRRVVGTVSRDTSLLEDIANVFTNVLHQLPHHGIQHMDEGIGNHNRAALKEH